MKPFAQLPFDSLPALPHKPHRYFATEARTVSMPSRPFGTHQVHLRVVGDGPPLLLVHGLMTTSYSWRYVLEPLSRHFTLYVPDLPGAGRSDKPLGTSYRPEAFAQWLDELTTALGIRGCDAIGNSMGGYICMWLALNHTGAIRRLVNLHSPGVPEARLYLLRSVLAIPGSRRLLAHLVHRDPLRWAHRNVHYFDERLKSLEEAREYGQPLASDEGVRAFTKFLAETLAPGPMRSFHRRLDVLRTTGQPFPVPLLLLYARKDPMVPPRFGDVFARAIPSAELVWLEGASHFAHVDAVERFLPPVLGFFGLSAD